MLNTAQPVVHDMAEAGRKHGKRARRAAKRASHEMKKGAEKAIDEARSALVH